jgi:hypothetical protein
LSPYLTRRSGRCMRVGLCTGRGHAKDAKGEMEEEELPNEMDDMEKYYNNDLYGLGDFNQIKNKIHCFVCHGEGHTMSRNKQGPKRNRRGRGIAGRNRRSGATDSIEVRHE